MREKLPPCAAIEIDAWGYDDVSVHGVRIGTDAAWIRPLIAGAMNADQGRQYGRWAALLGTFGGEFVLIPWVR
ncbi:MAG: hypothetical protein ACTHU0_22365 [Kofleriaceae bacterium]